MRRIPELDALRGVAALTIVVYHLRPDVVRGGWAAVDLFFVLSGYLITSIILRYEDSRNFLVAFYARRSLRIWPIYYLALVAVLAINPWKPDPESIAGLPYYLTYMQNIPYYWSGRVPLFPSCLYHTWTLALEEQFYLLWPALVLLTGRRAVIPLSLALVGMSFWARTRGFEHTILLARCDGFALGALLAALLFDRGRLERHAGPFCATLGLIAAGSASWLAWALVKSRGALVMAQMPGPVVLTTNLLAFGIVGLVAFRAGARYLAPLRAGWLVYLGQISYGLYLYHYIVIRLAEEFAARWGLGRPGWLLAAEGAASLGLAALSWKYVEKPILALKERFHYRSAPRLPLATEAPPELVAN